MTRARRPRAGDRYRYAGPEPLGLGVGALLPGTVVEVREVVDADEPGAWAEDADGVNVDAVVVEWSEPSIGIVGHVEQPYERLELVYHPETGLPIRLQPGDDLPAELAEVLDLDPADVERLDGYLARTVTRRRAVAQYGPRDTRRAVAVTATTIADRFEPEAADAG